MEEEYSKYLFGKLFSDYECNYECGIMSYEEFRMNSQEKKNKNEQKEISYE